MATAFEIFWMIFEPILFGLTGTQIVFEELDIKVVTITIACIAIAFVVSKNKNILSENWLKKWKKNVSNRKLLYSV